jgi:hypothetical protein
MQTEEEKEARRIGKNYRRIWNIAQHGMISGWEDWRNGQFVRKSEEEIAEVQRKLELAGQEMNSLSGNSLEWAKKAAREGKNGSASSNMHEQYENSLSKSGTGSDDTGSYRPSSLEMPEVSGHTAFPSQ